MTQDDGPVAENDSSFASGNRPWQERPLKLSSERLRPNPVAPWELRLGDLRVYFEVEERPKVELT